ncbi:MAG: CehA/McbA family metallohydrolase [Planctomycetaceae bacterium]
MINVIDVPGPLGLKRGSSLQPCRRLFASVLVFFAFANSITAADTVTSRTTHLVSGNVIDAESGKTLACRLYMRNKTTGEWLFPKSADPSGTAVEYRRQIGQTSSLEMHTTLSAHPFQISLPPGQYRIEAVRGKEFLPTIQKFDVSNEPVSLRISLQRFINMPESGWFSGDVHAHRPIDEMSNVIVAEDLNTGFPMTYWVRDSQEIPSASGPALEGRPIEVAPNHFLYPVNTEYEIFSVNGKRHTQGAVLVLNHKRPLNVPAPPSLSVAEEARRQGGLLDLEKHSWAWSMMVVPIMNVDLFELSNNHNWRTEFAFSQWTIENAPNWPEVERNATGFTEPGWTEFALQTYYSLLNCGFRMRVSAGTGSGVHPVPAGHSRVYVHTGDPFSYEKWIKHLNAGHSFVTTGPLMNVRFNGDLPGTTWKTPQQQNDVAITGTVTCINRLRSIEVLHNGVVLESLNGEPTKTEYGVWKYTINTKASLLNSGWIALRCFEDLPGEKVSFAHTNPVFMDVAGHPQKPRRRDAEFFVQRMNEEIARNDGVLPDESLSEYHKAKAIYEEILSRAED